MEWIKIVGIIIAGVIFGIIWVLRYFKSVKNKRLRYDQVEQFGGEIVRLAHEKKAEQWKITKERGDILFSEFLKIFCVKMEISEDSKEAGAYDALVLNNIRRQTDIIMEEAIDRNNMANRLGDNWTRYKKRKFDYILSKIIQFIKTIWREDIIGFQHEIVVGKCRNKMIEIYMDHIHPMFDEIKEISIKYEDKIKIHKEILEDLKNGGRKKNFLKGVI